MTASAIQNVLAVLDGKPPLNPIPECCGAPGGRALPG
jgi:hypothetical protein